MDLEFTTDQDELRDGVRAMLARECPMSLVREVVEKGTTPDALWSQMVELGWPALTVPEAAGGLGLGAVELAVVVEELGRVLAPGPFLPTVTQFVPVVAEAGTPEQQERFLGGIAAGELTGTLALVEESGSVDAGHVTTTATRTATASCSTARRRRSSRRRRSTRSRSIARTPGTRGDDGVGAFVVSRADVRTRPDRRTRRDPAARPRRARRRPDRRRPRARRAGAGDGGGGSRAVEEATTALAVEIVGAAQPIFDITLAYAKQREQFGVPIGSFQAIKHKFADMLVALERARATGYFAALTIAEDDDRRALATSTAKAAAGDCAALLAKEGIQIHGGIGYTWEHDMHLYVRRVKSSALLFGNAAQHRARIADLSASERVAASAAAGRTRRGPESPHE